MDWGYGQKFMSPIENCCITLSSPKPSVIDNVSLGISMTSMNPPVWLQIDLGLLSGLLEGDRLPDRWCFS
jgi:hypothetical protein